MWIYIDSLRSHHLRCDTSVKKRLAIVMSLCGQCCMLEERGCIHECFASSGREDAALNGPERAKDRSVLGNEPRIPRHSEGQRLNLAQ